MRPGRTDSVVKEIDTVASEGAPPSLMTDNRPAVTEDPAWTTAENHAWGSEQDNSTASVEPARREPTGRRGPSTIAADPAGAPSATSAARRVPIGIIAGLDWLRLIERL